MEGFIKQSTAHTFQIGPFLDETNGKDAEIALTIAYTDVFLSKHGGGAAAKTDTTNLTGTSDARGYYDCVLDGTDTGTIGCLKVMAHISGALPVWATFEVLPANVYDSLVAGSDKLQVDIEEVDGDATAAANLNSACDNYSATRGLSGTALPDAAANAAGGLPISAGGALALDTQLANTHEITAARMGALTDWLEGERLDLILDIIAADTTTDIPALIGTAQADLDIITGTAGVVLDGDAITSAKIADDAIATEHIATGALTADSFAADALVAGTFATDCLTNDALAASFVNEIWDATEAVTGDTHSFETILARLYMFLQHKMEITDASGDVDLKDTGGSSTAMTQNIADNDTLTTRTEAAWV